MTTSALPTCPAATAPEPDLSLAEPVTSPTCTSPEPVVTTASAKVPVASMSADSAFTSSVLPVGHGDLDPDGRVRTEQPAPVTGDVDHDAVRAAARRGPRRRRPAPAALSAVSSTVVRAVSSAVTVTWPAPLRTTRVVGPGVSKVCMELLLFPGVGRGGPGQPTQPRICLRRTLSPVTVMRLLPSSRSMRRPSRASRTASTSQALSDWPMPLAASSARTLTDSGSRRVIRDWLSSSGSGGAGGAGGVGRCGRLGRARPG